MARSRVETTRHLSDDGKSRLQYVNSTALPQTLDASDISNWSWQFNLSNGLGYGIFPSVLFKLWVVKVKEKMRLVQR